MQKILFSLLGGAMIYFVFMRKSWAYPPAAGDYVDLIKATEKQNNIPTNLLGRLLQQESDFNPSAHNVGSDAQGIAQIVPRWHPTVSNPYNPIEAIPYAGMYLQKLYTSFGYWDLALAAYNWGWGNVRNLVNEHGEQGFELMPTETKNYVTEILADVNV